ncbi:protocadherin Fat 4-like, partial [Saccostrea echinata]|uniref:protocadherin Fat 4-like n=1 Tax=Saccostrea echinata TaxID=191078 RepID=UPI002A831AF8
TVFAPEYCHDNVNDGQPVFSSPPIAGITVSIREDAIPGFVVYTVSATDTEYYELDTKIPEFGINGDKLVVTGYLDYEATRTYTLVFSAYECIYALPVKSNITINIEPVNEFFPRFTREVIYKDINENEVQDHNVTVLTDLICTDWDQGPNPGCSLAIQDGDDPTQKFKISGTRIQTTNAAVDYELLSGQDFLYSLTVIGVDNPKTDPRKTGTANVFVNINPINDNSPAFLDRSYSTQIMENAIPGTGVLNTSADDKDLGLHGDLTFSITAGNEDNRFYIDPKSGQISTLAPLDFETKSTYQLTIRVSDGGGIYDQVFANIGVINVNDVTPVCSAYQNVVEVDETIPPGSILMTLTCTDLDGVAALTYNLQDDVDGTFSINPSGEITLTKALDYDLGIRSYRLTVIVSDGVHNLLVKRHVIVKPVNEYPPELPPSATIQTSENDATGSVLYTATAKDADVSRDNLNTFSFFIASVSNNGGDTFWIDTNNGDIVLVKNLDFENEQNYVITYAVEDDGNFRTTSTLTVSVLNVNDNIPRCTPDAISVQIPENTDTSVPSLYKLICTDDDGDSLQYDVIYQRPNDAAFDVNSSGKLLLEKPLDYETRTFYEIKIGVTDGLSTATVNMAVNVLDVNEGAPEFTSSGIYNGTLPETSRKGVFIAQVSATDVDISIVTFTFKDNNHEFILDPYSGEIFLNGQLDREITPMYTLLVLASDGMLTSTATVYVNVEDVNEPPKFVRTAYRFTNDERSPKATIVGQVSARDIDKEGKYGQITYAIESGNIHSHFTIDSNDGTISVAEPTDYEETSLIELVVSVTDMGEPPLFDKCTVTITIVDVNDNPPTFQVSSLSIPVSESAAKGTLLTQVSATDSDSPLNNNNRFSFSELSVTPFSVHSSTGIVTVEGPLDRETEDRYHMEILATDAGYPAQTGTLTVNVHIEDINDNTPNIVGNYNTTISEDTPVQHVVYKISAEDDDLEENSRLHYSIESGNYNSNFKIEPYSGYVQVASTLDRETRSLYHLVIKVSDHGLPPRYSTSTATIAISDINDNSPTFIQASREYFVDENVPLYTSVGRLEAVDDDEGINAQLTFKISAFLQGTPGSFLINETSGELFTNMVLDREAESFYQLMISVLDGGSPALSSEITINIYVNDLNDNYPNFRNTFYSKTISESTAVGTKIVTTAAVDVDLGFFSEITYELDLTSPEGLQADFYFTVHPVFGDVILKRSLDFETHEALSMIVVAMDGDTPPKTATANVTIYITDVNDNAPEFFPIFYNTEAPAAETCDFVLARLSATDKDKTNNAELFYVLDPAYEQSPFTVNTDTGEVRARYDLNSSQYIVRVNAQDNGKPRLTSSVSATVRIDTFQPEVNVVSFTLSLNKDQYLKQETDFLLEVTLSINSIYPTPYVRRWCLYDMETYVVVHLYAVENDLSDWIYNLHLPKPFLKTNEILDLVNPFGTNKDKWSRFYVKEIDEYFVPNNKIEDPKVIPVSKSKSTKVNALAIALPILFLALIVAAVLFFVAWRRKWCRKRDKEEKGKKNSENTPSSPNTPRIVSPTGIKINPENVGGRNGHGPFINVPVDDNAAFVHDEESHTDEQSSTPGSLFDKRGVDPVTGWVYVESSRTKERRWIKFPDKDPLFKNIQSSYL